MKSAVRVCLAIVLAAVLAGTAVLVIGRSGSENTNAGRDTRSVIAAAMKSSGFGMQTFPRSEGTRRCTIHGGGPAPGSSFQATCKTRVVSIKGATVIVYFTHVIDGGAHTWAYSVSPSLRATFINDFGPGIAPEEWA